MANSVNSNNLFNSSLLTTTSGSTTSTTAVGPSLTEDEKKKLENLKQDRDSWVKQEKVKSFQKLPAHLRQRMVDQACIKECLEEINNIDQTKFEGQSEIEALAQKEVDNGTYIMLDGTATTWNHVMLDGTNYTPHEVEIIDMFTKDELMEAHAAVTLEENLGED